MRTFLLLLSHLRIIHQIILFSTTFLLHICILCILCFHLHSNLILIDCCHFYLSLDHCIYFYHFLNFICFTYPFATCNSSYTPMVCVSLVKNRWQNPVLVIFNFFYCPLPYTWKLPFSHLFWRILTLILPPLAPTDQFPI